MVTVSILKPPSRISINRARLQKTIYSGAADAPVQHSSSLSDPLEKELASLSITDSVSDSPALSLHPLSSDDALIIRVDPPRAPAKGPSGHGLRRTPCDIVLVIDVSGSMNDAAPAPAADPDGSEDNGLSVLDLTKHAARTILATLGDDDRLGIVTFAMEATVVQELEPMTWDGKAVAARCIDDLRAWGGTNLWHGILEGIAQFRSDDVRRSADPARMPAIMVLTDGEPNYMCPAQGYAPKLSGMPDLPAPVHTFGFGYSIRSGLLKCIAEATGGNFSFIPDAGMIGTVFVHAVANLQAAYAHNASLVIKHPAAVVVEETTGYVVGQENKWEDNASKEHTVTRISLGPILFGQSRDLYLRLRPKKPSTPLRNVEKLFATAELVYSRMTGASYSATAAADLRVPSDSLSEAEIAYHKSRSQICAYLSSLFPADGFGERLQVTQISDKYLADLQRLIDDLPASRFDDAANKSLMEDLSGPDPKGQVSLALKNQEYWEQWGGHYLLSLLNAHTRQYCNSFKDPGPLRYGAESPLFRECRDALDTAFDTIPPPKPSLVGYGGGRGGSGGGSGSAPISMSHYNSPGNPCFAGSAPVTLASGRNVPVRALRRGAMVQTPLGPRRVAAVLVTPVAGEVLCRVGGLLVTPWHPVSADGGKSWAFPAQLASSAVRYTGCIYSLLLQPDRIPTAHAVHVGGLWGVTLGHGITSGLGDVRAHSFFGDFAAVAKSLRGLGMRRNGLVVGGGVRRDEKTGLVAGFRRGSGRVPMSMGEVKGAGMSARGRA